MDIVVNNYFKKFLLEQNITDENSNSSIDNNCISSEIQRQNQLRL